MPVAVESLEARVKALEPWYHRIELPGGLVTPGWAPISPAAYRLPQSLAGLRVLDIGAWDGYWSFECIARGAAEVVAIDDFSDPADCGTEVQPFPHPGWTHFDLCREALGIDPERCRRMKLNLYEATPDKLGGRFDLVLMLGVLYHLRYPMVGLDIASALSCGRLLVETAILDDYSPYRGGLGHGYPGNQMVMEFYPGTQYGRVGTNWWVPTLQLLANMVDAAGFDEVGAWKLEKTPDSTGKCRGFVLGTRTQKGGTG